MISPEKWKEFCDMLDMEYSILLAQAIQRHEEQKREWRKAEEDLLNKDGDMMYSFGVLWKSAPFVPPIQAAKTIEACLTWMAEGEPVFVKKIKVEFL